MLAIQQRENDYLSCKQRFHWALAPAAHVGVAGLGCHACLKKCRTSRELRTNERCVPFFSDSAVATVM